jgi:hypothetical protein
VAGSLDRAGFLEAVPRDGERVRLCRAAVPGRIDGGVPGSERGAERPRARVLSLADGHGQRAHGVRVYHCIQIKSHHTQKKKQNKPKEAEVFLLYKAYCLRK